jgi:hypothetical protein
LIFLLKQGLSDNTEINRLTCFFGLFGFINEHVFLYVQDILVLYRP